jgi:lipoprotein-releasing system ATP-binding protein
MVQDGAIGPDEVVLRARGLAKAYRTEAGTLQILTAVDLEVRRGESVSVMGASGVGKSTLLHVLGTLDRPSSGTLEIRGTDMLTMSEPDLAVFRNRHIGFVFQFHHLLPEFTAVENVMMPVLISGDDPDAGREAAVALLTRVGLGQRLTHRPGELSGGECQRVAVVRSLIRRPDIVLADEPSGNLDEATSDQLHGLLGELAAEYRQAFVIMTHDRGLADRAQRRALLEAGQLRFRAAPGEAESGT